MVNINRIYVNPLSFNKPRLCFCVAGLILCGWTNLNFPSTVFNNIQFELVIVRCQTLVWSLLRIQEKY